MTVNFQLEEQDFLQYQLYDASQSKKFRKYRLRKRITFPIVFVFFSLLLLFVKVPVGVSFASFGAALAWWITYPVFDKSRYRKYFLGFVQRTYDFKFGKKVSIEILENKIIGNDIGQKLILRPEDIVEITFIPELVLIRMKDTRVMMAPVERIEHSELFKKVLADFAERWEIAMRRDLNWKWQ